MLNKIKELREEWLKMLEQAEDEKIAAIKGVYEKHGQPVGQLPKGDAIDFWSDLNEAECAIYRKYPYYTDHSEEIDGADRVFEFLITQLEGGKNGK